jgi:hypothetical protein
MYWYIAAFIGVLFYALTLKSQTPTQKPPSLQPPTANEGLPKKKLYGTRTCKMNVGYHGDVKMVAIKKKAGKK